MNENLPIWAEKKSDGGYMEIGAQLATRDGRRHGNAFVNDLEDIPGLGMVANVVTDAGSQFKMTRSELISAFYAPRWVLKIEAARKKFVRRGM